MAEEHKRPEIKADETIVQKLEKDLLEIIEGSNQLTSELLDSYHTQYKIKQEEARLLYRYLVAKTGKKANRQISITASEEELSTSTTPAAATPGCLEIAPPRMTAQITGELNAHDASDGHDEFFSHDHDEETLAVAFNRDVNLKQDNS